MQPQNCRLFRHIIRPEHRIYKPFNKPNKNPLYINASSNPPPSVLKQVPKSVSRRITANSCYEDIFRKSTLFYESILQDCGFNENIKYCRESVSSRRRKNRSKNIIWCNPAFRKNVKTNFGKHFFKLLKKHFGKNYKYHKIFNKNNAKVSYSCMANMTKIINSYKKYVASKKVQANQNLCNCRNPDNFPLDNKCLTSNR